jgi:hypothetical protein
MAQQKCCLWFLGPSCLGQGRLLKIEHGPNLRNVTLQYVFFILLCIDDITCSGNGDV